MDKTDQLINDIFAKLQAQQPQLQDEQLMASHIMSQIEALTPHATPASPSLRHQASWWVGTAATVALAWGYYPGTQPGTVPVQGSPSNLQALSYRHHRLSGNRDLSMSYIQNKFSKKTAYEHLKQQFHESEN